MLTSVVVNANTVPGVQHNTAFVGSERCGQCLQQELQQWQKSHHAKSMMLPGVASVLGKFENKEVRFNDVVTRFTKREGGQRWFKLLPNENSHSGSPFHWSRQLQNWSSRCAECHSTSVSKVSDRWAYLSNLSAVAPNDPEVKRRIAQMRHEN